MIVKRVGPMSVAKIAATLYVVIGLLIGGVISLVAVVGGAMSGTDSGPMGMLFGTAAVILLPIFYGCIGFVFSLLGAMLYNLVAGLVGGVELDVQ